MDSRLERITDISVIEPAEGCDDLYFRLFNNTYDGISIFELNSTKIRALYLNERYFSVVGYTREQYQPYLDNITVTLFEEDEQNIFENARRSVATGSDFYCEVRGYRADGSVGWFCVRARIVDFIKSDNIVFLASINDITERKELSHQLNINHERYRILEETCTSSLFEYLPVTDRMTFSIDKSRKDIVLENYTSYLRSSMQLHPCDVNFYFGALSRACRKPCRGFIDVRTLNVQKTEYVLSRIQYSSIADEMGTIISVVGKVDIISEEKGMIPICISSSWDNAGVSVETVESYVDEITSALSERRGECFMVAVDIDGLAEINEKYGKDVGNDTVRIAQGLIEKAFGDAVIFRFISDEFLIYAENINESSVYDMVEKLRVTASTVDICGGNNDFSLSFSFGAAHAVNPGTKLIFKDMFITASKALFEAKKEGGNGIHVEKII